MSSFIADKIVMDGLTYDDVLLIPAYSEVLPRTVELTTKFSRHIELKVPFVTAAMDTVTEAPMAIAIAREGGIGVIHKNMSIEEQARQGAIVKRAENGMIYDPVTIKRGRTVGDALNMMSEYHIGGIPVVDDENKLVGIVTNRDLRFEQNPDRKIDEVMTSENLVTTHQQTDLSAAAKILQENKIEKLPVVDKDGRLVGLITYKDITKAKDKPMACKDEKACACTPPCARTPSSPTATNCWPSSRSSPKPTCSSATRITVRPTSTPTSERKSTSTSSRPPAACSGTARLPQTERPTDTAYT